jgi:hypothetical protein
MTHIRLLLITVLALPGWANAGDDLRQLVEMPPMMQQHMLGNMRDHLLALTEIQQALGQGEFERAAGIAEQRIGMTSLQAHGAEHLAQMMRPAMRETGDAMHRAASRFAVMAEEAAVSGDLKSVFSAMAEITQQCAACHTAFRLH